MVSLNLSVLSSETINCYSTDCSCHLELLDDYAHHLVHTPLDCACLCIPSHTTSSPRRYKLAGKMVLVVLRKRLISGIRCGLRQAVLHLVSCLVSRKMLKVGITMPIDDSSVDSIFFYRKN